MRTQTESTSFSSVSDFSTSAASDWSLILPAPGSRTGVSQRFGPYAAQPLQHPPQPFVEQTSLGLPVHDGQGNFASPGFSIRPLMHYRAESDLTHASFEEMSTDEFSSLSSTDYELSSASAGSDPEASPFLSPLSLVSVQPLSPPPAGLGLSHVLERRAAERERQQTSSSTESSPSQTYDQSLSRVPTIVGLSRLNSTDTPASTRGFRSTVGKRTAARRHHRQTPSLSPVHATSFVDSPTTRDDWTVDHYPTPLLSSFLWPFTSPTTTSKPSSPFFQTVHFLRSLLALDEPTLLLIFSPPPAPSTSTTASPEQKSVSTFAGEGVRRPGLGRMRSSSEPGTESRRRLLMMAVGHIAGQAD